MPVLFDWESEKILRVRYYDIISGDDAVDASLRMSSDPRFDDLRGGIIDTIDISENIADITHIEKLVAISRVMSKSNPRIRNAIVLNEDETTGALAALYTFLGNELVWDVEMFHTMTDARSWVMDH
ncbi:Uncharacterised protein [BD1-7 clade bacterium]|uniref:STAS/SEC14 domain-containing protein n=1 Tax=BD1-7 clade bacterium TaxID=2029982 RepID=A0A5S9Q022_9GAMM|nr:Uncharacterised protein [BD1-7 clade bacterium]